jgi:phosphoribosyl-ATP pyrophosphohydrolase/phosphoribosyl-AMP cyclohydrolase/histidinol dehydrogenase
MILRRVRSQDASRATTDLLDESTCREAARIVDDVRARGEPALREHAERHGDLRAGEAFVHERAALETAAQHIDDRDMALLRRTAERIRAFASAQRRTIADLTTSVPGGRAGHTIEPIERAGCYAPGGRFPLPSSVLMTAITARTAGVREVWVASPRPAPITLAAACIAGADALVAVGGAQAIGALAFGAGVVPACDAVVGPGNRWVTAAKQYVAGRVAIDVLAGPSELVVLADAEADPALVAADLLAQAEHDDDALPILVSLDEDLVRRVEIELERQLATLPAADTARRSLARGFAVVEPRQEVAIDVVSELAPAHLQISLRDSSLASYLVRHCGAISAGEQSAQVFGDYGGTNHVLPTGRGARSCAGLSVFTFLRVRTWQETNDARELADDAARMARLEGLEGHARSAQMRQRAASSGQQ